MDEASEVPGVKAVIQVWANEWVPYAGGTRSAAPGW